MTDAARRPDDAALPSVSERIAQFAARCRYEDLPERLREFARYHILDVVGCAIAARRSDFARRALDGLAFLGEAGSSSVIGFPLKLPLRDAVLLNGILAHGLDFDDTHTASQVHPTASTFPCALGLAERLRASGRDLLTAYLLGAEVAIRLGIGANNTLQGQGFHPTGIAGHMGCAITAAKLYGLDAEHTVLAQGLAGSTASAISEYRVDGSWNKRLHPGWAAVGGLTAASLARAGYVGSRRVYEGQYGLFRSHAGSRFGDVDVAAMTRDLGRIWHVENAAIKPLPACHLLHACADSAMFLRRQHDLQPQDIVEACALLHPDAFRVVCEPAEARRRPASEYVAQFSVYYVVAACLARGRFTFAELSPESLADRQILALAERVTYRADPESQYPRYLSGGVVVKTRDGRTFTHREAINRGNGDRALSGDEIIAKFMENAEITVSREHARRICELVLECDGKPAPEIAAGLTASWATASAARPGGSGHAGLDSHGTG